MSDQQFGGDNSDAMDMVFGVNPRRPSTPDLWRISEILLHNDGAVDDAPISGKDVVWKSITEDVVDLETVLFMAQQRVIRAFGAATVTDPANIAVMSKITAVVVDAFITGAQFERAGGHRDAFDTGDTGDKEKQ